MPKTLVSMFLLSTFSAKTSPAHRTLDRLTDALDADEVAYYTSQRDALKQLIAEYREELERLQQKKILGRVSPEIVQDFASSSIDLLD
jgi:hypothetical protein